MDVLCSAVRDDGAGILEHAGGMIALGEVIDFIDFRAIDFAVFNFADSVVCVGAGLLVLALVLEIARDAKKKAPTEETAEGEEADE